jgi:Tetratricopeptide repeat
MTSFGADHPNMATQHSNLGSVLTDLGDLAGARTHHERAPEIGQAILRPNHPTMATFRDNLDHALQQLGGEEGKGDW